MNGLLRQRQYTGLPEAEVRHFMKQIISAVRHLHEEHSVVHRDIKLHNIFLDRSMNAKLGDFGISRRLPSAKHRCKGAVGTPNYLAPEIVRISCKGRKGKLHPANYILTGEDYGFSPIDYSYSFEVDIWSMGAVCFALLVGRPPFESENVETTYYRIMRCEYQFPTDADVSNSARCFVDAMLTVDPGYR